MKHHLPVPLHLACISIPNQRTKPQWFYAGLNDHIFVHHVRGMTDPSKSTAGSGPLPPAVVINDAAHPTLTTPRSIRLLRLKGSMREQLTCEIFEASLDDAPSYEALSYAWDAQTLDQSIKCNGQSTLVTQNCKAALRQLRFSMFPRILWIDAICIDQTSLEERNQQIQLMGEIYKSAKQVLVWIGEGDKGIATALENILHIEALFSDSKAWFNTQTGTHILEFVKKFNYLQIPKAWLRHQPSARDI
jgi:hypothetical protein